MFLILNDATLSVNMLKSILDDLLSTQLGLLV